MNKREWATAEDIAEFDAALAAKKRTAAEESLISKRASDVVPESISWLWRDRFPHRRLSVLTGPPCGAKGSVIILSAEDDNVDTIVPRLTAAGADCSKVVLVEAVRVPVESGKAHERGFDLSKDVGKLEKLCLSENAVLLVIDPISAYFGKKSDSHNNTDVRGLLAPLAALAAKCRAAVVAVTHDRKSGGAAGERTLGSVAFLAAPRAVWAVTPETSDEGEPTGRNIFTRIKGNLGPDPGGLAYEIEPRRIGSESEPDGIGTSRIKWHDGAITKTADQLYAAASEASPKKRDAPERDGAEDFLRGLLVSGRMQVSKIEAEAKAAGLAWATVRRAQANIGITPNRVGFGKDGIWYWQLSSQSPIDAIDAHLLTKEGGGEHLCKNVSAYRKNPIDAHQAEDRRPETRRPETR